MYNPLKNCAYVHSCYVPASNNIHGCDAVVVAVKDVDTLESKLQIIPNPKIKIWVAKQGTRTYEKKRECVKFSELDMYVTEYRKRGEVIAKALGKRAYGYINLRALLESPYVYGADISPEITIKAEYMKNVSKGIQNYNIGIMDIETSVLGDEQIILNGYCDWRTKSIHCWILSSWFQPNEHWEQELMDRYHKELNVIYQQLNDKAKAVFHPDEWTVKFYLCDTEKQLIWDSVRFMVLAKPDFLGSWNSAYEGGYIPKRAQFRGIDVVELFAHPDVPPEYRMFKFKEDTRRTEHLADKWHVAYWPGYTYWYDPMCLYGRLRKVKGREVMYTLDYICGKNLGAGKMKFGMNATHYAMQTKDKVGYAVYNCFDVLQPCILDQVTSDVSSMELLIGPALLPDFSHQTVQLKAQFYEYCLSKGAVPGTVSGSMKSSYDGQIGNVGGAVLNPGLMRTQGSPYLKESDDRTSLYRLCCDLDVTSFYPSLTIAMNISRETKLCTVLWIEGCPYTLEYLQSLTDRINTMSKDKERERLIKEQERCAKRNAEYIFAFFSNYPTILENAVSICKEHFNIPGYQEMLELFAYAYHRDDLITTTVVPTKTRISSIHDISKAYIEESEEDEDDEDW